LAGGSGTEAAHDAVALQLTGVPGESHGVRFPVGDPGLSAGRSFVMPAIRPVSEALAPAAPAFEYADESHKRLFASVVNWNAKKADRRPTRPKASIIDLNITEGGIFVPN